MMQTLGTPHKTFVKAKSFVVLESPVLPTQSVVSYIILQANFLSYVHYDLSSILHINLFVHLELDPASQVLLYRCYGQYCIIPHYTSANHSSHNYHNQKYWYFLVC